MDLPFDDVFTVLEDDDEFFWLAGSAGLFRVKANGFGKRAFLNSISQSKWGGFWVG